MIGCEFTYHQNRDDIADIHGVGVNDWYGAIKSIGWMSKPSLLEPVNFLQS